VLRAADIAQNIGDLRRLGSALHLVAMAQFFQGKPAEAVKTSEKIIALGEESSDRQLSAGDGLGLALPRNNLVE